MTRAHRDLCLLRTEILAYLLATYRQRPTRIRGMRIELLDVDVRTPRGMRRHAARLRDLRWNDEAERVEGASQRRRVRDLDDLTSTPGGAAAVAIDRGDMSAAELAQHRLKQETDRAEHLYTELRSAIDSGALNRSGGIRLEVVEAAVEELTGRRAPRSRPDDVPAAIADRAEGKRPRAEHEPDGPPLYITADEDPDDD